MDVQAKEVCLGMFRLGMEEAAKLLDQEAASAEKLVVDAAERGDSHAKMRLWAIRDHVQTMAATVRHFATDQAWCESVLDPAHNGLNGEQPA